MIYLDANVFVLASLNNEERGDRARTLLRDVQSGELEAASSTLTFDELVWAVKKHRTLEDSVLAGEAFLNMPRLNLVAATGDILASALLSMKKYRLDPRDSIHLASAMSAGAKALVSADRHFDRVREVKRKDITELTQPLSSSRFCCNEEPSRLCLSLRLLRWSISHGSSRHFPSVLRCSRNHTPVWGQED